MRQPLRFFLALVLSCFFSSAQNNDATFENANAAYNAAQFEKAVMLYKEILEAGDHSAALYYNLANSYYRLNQVGESIFYFEKARQLDPKDEDLNINIVFAQNMAVDAVEVLPKSQITLLSEKIFTLFSSEGWAYFIVVCSWILAILWGLYVWNKVPIIKRSFFISAILAGVILIVSVSVTFVKSSNEDNTFYGILFNEKLEVWAEPNTRAEVLFLLHEGTKVQMLDKLQEWQKIRIANGSEGWVKDGEIRDLKGFKEDPQGGLVSLYFPNRKGILPRL